jgi:hypothetical protein
MTNAERWRWAILLSALAMTLGGVFFPVDDPALDEAAVVPAVVPPPVNAVLSAAAIAPDPVSVAREGEMFDPFAPRGWQAPPAPVQATPPPAPPVPAPPVAAGPPPLPFQFMGRLDDDGVEVVYVSQGERSWAVRTGETLDGTYKVLNLEPQRIEFEYLPTGMRQTLSLPASEK